MHLFSFFQTGPCYAWWFSTIYGLVSFIIIITASKDSRKRLFAVPKFNSVYHKSFFFMGMFVLSRGLIIYAVFVPITTGGLLFVSGLFISTASLILYGAALVVFCRSNPAYPVTKGLYRFFRHPIQLMTIFFWFGAGMACSSVAILIIVFILAVLSYPSFRAQEHSCVEHYGEEYIVYMNNVPRYFFF